MVPHFSSPLMLFYEPKQTVTGDHKHGPLPYVNGAIETRAITHRPIYLQTVKWQLWPLFVWCVVCVCLVNI